MLALIAVLSLAAEPVRLGAPGLTYVDIAPKKGDLFADRLLKELERHGLRVTGRAEMEAALGIERQRELLGCSETEGNCLAELVGALGADALLTGTLGRAGSGFVVSLKIVDSAAKTLAIASGRVDDEDALIDFLDAAAGDLARQVFKSLGKAAPQAQPEVEVVAAERKSARSNWPVPIAVGALAMVAGAVLWGLALNTQQMLLRGQPMTLDDGALNGTIQQGRLYEIIGWSLGGVGLALIGTGILIKVWPKSPAVALVPTPGGGAAVWSGALP